MPEDRWLPDSAQSTAGRPTSAAWLALSSQAALGAALAACPAPATVPLQVLLIGPPGSGKSTQGRRLAQERGVPHISVGNLVREALVEEGLSGEEIARDIRAGHDAPPEFVYRLLAQRLSRADAGSGFVLDGHPRSDQFDYFETLCSEFRLDHLQVIALGAPEEELLARLAARGRPDDTPASVRDRLEKHRAEAPALAEYFSARGVYTEVDGSGGPDEVAERISESLRWARAPTG